MRPPHVPVTMGSPRFHAVEVTGCTVIEAWFAAGDVLPQHTHDRPIFGIMLAGAFQTAIAHRRLDCPVASAWVEPQGERHANYIGREGARVLVLQPDPARVDLFGAFGRYVGEVRHVRHGAIASDAWRVSAELAIDDDLSTLAVDGLVQTMLASAARADRRGRTHAPPPPWLLKAQELVHASFRNPVSLPTLAAATGVSPWHLARGFRAHLHASVGEYARRLRVTWAAERLGQTDMPLAQVAAAAGFSDQSHLTREFRRQLGVTPEAYRRTVRRSGARAVVDAADDPRR